MKNRTTIDVKDKSQPTVMTGVLSVLISSVLCIGLTLMLTTAFDLDIKPIAVIAWTVISSTIFTVVHCLSKKKLSLAVLSAVPAMIILVISFDVANAREGLIAFLYYVQNNIVYTLPGDYSGASSKDAIMIFIAHFNMIPLCISTFTLSKRKFIPLSLIPFAPLFFFAVANVIMTPDQPSVICAATGVIALFFAHAFRHKNRKVAEKFLLIAMVPSFLFALVTALIFPLESYNKDNLAKNIIIDIRDAVSNISFDGDNEIIRMLDTANNGIEDPVWLTESISSNQLTALYTSNKDLTKVGPFNPSTGRIMEVRKDLNPGYDGQYYDGANLYLRVESLDTYKDNSLTRSKFPSRVYKDGADLPVAQGQYTISVTPLTTATTDITPYYTDLYASDSAEATSVGVYTSTADENEFYAASTIPVKVGDIFTEKYIEDYVYGTCLEVPERTRDAITMSGRLPDWYIDCLYGRSTLTDAEKVRAVTTFVRSLHPYSKDTAYPPDGADFVPWFITDAETGICVHYATTTVILLRMIGIPARYVCGFTYNRAFPGYTSYVYSEEAHAWFEFFVPGYGWIMGDSTPGMGSMAAPFDINGVVSAYPEVENISFARNRANITDHTPQGATPTPSEEPSAVVETSTETSADGSAEETPPSVDVSTPDTTAPSDPAPSSEMTEPSGTTIYIQPGQTITVDSDYDPATVYVVVNNDLMRNITIALFSVLGFAVLLILIRLGYVMYWRNKFSVKGYNDKIISYYHYYKHTHNFMRKPLPARASAIVDKTAFSGETMTREDLNLLIKACEKSIAIYTGRLSRFKRFIFSCLVVKISPYK